MPFDGRDFDTPKVLDTGLFPIWTKQGRRIWVSARFRGKTTGKTGEAGADFSSVRAAAVVRLLEDAKRLIEDRQTWAQRNYWRFSGRRCAIGALRAAAKSLDDPAIAWAAHAFLIKVARTRGFSSVEAINDRLSHTDVLRVFDKAIAAAQTEARS